MNNNLKILYKKCFSIALIAFLSLFFSIAQAKAIVLGTANWPPYIQDNPTYKGYTYEIVLAAFKEAGYDDIKIIFMPWEDAVKAMDEGQIDGVFPEYFSEEKKAVLLYTHSFSKSPIGFFKQTISNINYPNIHPDKNIAATLKSMRKYRFGVVKGYVNVAAFDKDTHLTKIYTNSDVDNLKQLYKGNIDLALIDQYTAEYLIDHQLPANYREKIIFMNPPLSYKKLYVGISRKDPASAEMVSDFNKGLAIIKKNGIFAQIIDRDAEINSNQIA